MKICSSGIGLRRLVWRGPGRRSQKKGPVENAKGGPPAALIEFRVALEHLHVLCLPALGTFDDGELHRLSFLQAAETVGLNCREMDENVLTILTGNKAVTLRVIEPLNCSLFHCVTRIPYI